MEQQEVGQVGRALAVVDDVVVPGFVEGETGEILQRPVVSTEAVEAPIVLVQVAVATSTVLPTAGSLPSAPGARLLLSLSQCPERTSVCTGRSSA